MWDALAWNLSRKQPVVVAISSGISIYGPSCPYQKLQQNRKCEQLARIAIEAMLLSETGCNLNVKMVGS
jgi:hypothetical protein